MSLEQLLARASRLLDAGRVEAAGVLVGVALGMAPDSAAALALQARCLLAGGDAEGALDAAREAARRSDSELVRTTLAASVDAAAAGRLRTARLALRRRDLAEAWEVLRGIAGLRYEDRLFVLVCAYTAGRPVLPAGDREEVLAWLLRDELDEAAAALGHGDHARARAATERADAIDGRCLLAALLGAEAAYRGAVADPTRSGIALRPVLADLRRAGELLRRLDESAEFRRRAEPLRARIGPLTRHVAARLRAHRARELIGRHDALVSTYAGRPISAFEASNARRSLAPLGEDVAKLRRQCPPGSPEALALAELAGAIRSLQRQLERYV